MWALSAARPAAASGQPVSRRPAGQRVAGSSGSQQPAASSASTSHSHRHIHYPASSQQLVAARASSQQPAAQFEHEWALYKKCHMCYICYYALARHQQIADEGCPS